MSDASRKVSGVQITELGITTGRRLSQVRREAAAQSDEQPTTGMEQGPPSLDDLAGYVHTVVNLVIEPGMGLPEEYVYTSIVLTVRRGRIEVVPHGGTASVTVGTGKPVRVSTRGRVLCDDSTCDLESGQTVVLGPGNGLSLAGGTAQVRALGKRPAEVQMSAMLRESEVVEGACWICPPVITR